MKIERNTLERISIEEFADRNDLIMEVHERHQEPNSMRFYAHFKGAEVSDGTILSGVYGNGSTEEQAINDYAKKISRTFLVIDAFSKTRKELRVPVLLPYEPVNRGFPG